MPIVSGNLSIAGPADKSLPKIDHPDKKNTVNVIVIDSALFRVLRYGFVIFNIDVDFWHGSFKLSYLEVFDLGSS
jgi:hypothetical protein